jgi:hypothetical protein
MSNLINEKNNTSFLINNQNKTKHLNIKRCFKISMAIKQINLKLPENLFNAANNYVKNFGFRNIQELVSASLREKIFDHNEYDESFSDKEIELIDKLIEVSIKNKDFSSEEELDKLLLK